MGIDIDNDGDNDILSASGGDNKIAWYENIVEGVLMKILVIII